MKYRFQHKIPYTLKDVTGIEEKYRVGISIVEDGNVIGGISYTKNNMLFSNAPAKKCFNICGMELLPEHRNKGKGTEIVRQILEKNDCIHAAVQNEKAWAWWKKMGAQVHSAILFPQEEGKPDPKAHTLVFVLGRDNYETMKFRSVFQAMLEKVPGTTQTRTVPETDFTRNIK